VPGSEPGGHCDPVATKAAGRDGHAECAGKAVSFRATVGEDPGNAQPERGDRRESDLGRAVGGCGGEPGRIVEVYRIVWRGGRNLRVGEPVDGEIGVGSVPLHPAEPDSVVAGGDSGAGDHDEPEPAGPEGSREKRIGLYGESAVGDGDSRVGAQAEFDGGTVGGY